MPQVDTHELFASTPSHAVFAVTVVSPSSLCHYRIVPKTNRCPNSQLSRYIDAWQRVYVSHAEVCRSGPLFHQPCGVPFPYNLPRDEKPKLVFSNPNATSSHASGGSNRWCKHASHGGNFNTSACDLVKPLVCLLSAKLCCCILVSALSTSLPQKHSFAARFNQSNQQTQDLRSNYVPASFKSICKHYFWRRRDWAVPDVRGRLGESS